MVCINIKCPNYDVYYAIYEKTLDLKKYIIKYFGVKTHSSCNIFTDDSEISTEGMTKQM